MILRAFFVLLLLSPFEVLNGSSIYKKKHECEKYSRQLMNRIKNASKDYNYLANSLECNLRYIFDGAYGKYHSNLYELNERMQNGDKCRKSSEGELERMGESPFDGCYNATEISSGYRIIDGFERGAKETQGHGGEKECLEKLRALSEEVELFSTSIGATVKAFEKRVEKCVAEKMEVVSGNLKSINESFNDCMQK